MILPGKYETYMLFDPDGTEGLRYIGFRLMNVGWRGRWKMREHDGSQLGAWFRGLDERGWTPGEDIRYRLAYNSLSDVKILIETMNVLMADCHGGQLPTTMLKEPAARGNGHCRPVSYQEDGVIVSFPSLDAASLAVGIDRTWLRHCITCGEPHKNRVWFISR